METIIPKLGNWSSRIEIACARGSQQTMGRLRRRCASIQTAEKLSGSIVLLYVI